jgi:MYXO-CTERM domain-containing protein
MLLDLVEILKLLRVCDLQSISITLKNQSIMKKLFIKCCTVALCTLLLSANPVMAQTTDNTGTTTTATTDDHDDTGKYGLAGLLGLLGLLGLRKKDDDRTRPTTTTTNR